MVSNCVQPPLKGVPKRAPEHTMEINDPEIKTITNEFLRLSKRNNIVFENQVSIGFRDLKKYKERVIGLATYGGEWREIDLDREYWEKATWLTKIALLYHELTHAYCTRRHDWAKDKKYRDPDMQAVIDLFNPEMPPLSLLWPPPGFYDDGCPLSLMHPTIIDDECTQKHYSEYVKEMFQRCDPF